MNAYLSYDSASRTESVTVGHEIMDAHEPTLVTDSETEPSVTTYTYVNGTNAVESIQGISIRMTQPMARTTPRWNTIVAIC